MASLFTFFCFQLVLSSNYFMFINGLMFLEQYPLLLSTKRMQKNTRLHFYFHDIHDGTNPSAIRIINPPDGSVYGFGSTFMMDNPLTEGTEPGSKIVGRAQGIYAIASQHDSGLLMVLNFAFTEGMYNGSTLSVLGRNPWSNLIREMPIVGGSGIFRYASGYALVKTVSLSPKSGNAVVEYNVSVLHF